MNVEPKDPGGSWVDLAVCADDFGLGDGINEAVLKLARSRRISGIGVLVEGPAWKTWAPLLDIADVDVGLHLNFTESLGGPGPVFPLSALIARAYSGLLEYGDLRMSIEYQLDLFEAAMGRAPDYVDGHQHVHQLPVIREALLSTLVRRYNKPGPWLRSTVRPVSGLPWRGSGSDRKAWLIETLGGRSLRRMATRLGLTTNAHLLGVYDFDPIGVPYGHRMERWLDGVRNGDALMCHPATSADPTDPIGACRRQEFVYLSSDEFAQSLRVRHIRVARLSRAAPGLSSQDIEPAAAALWGDRA